MVGFRSERVQSLEQLVGNGQNMVKSEMVKSVMDGRDSSTI